MNGVGSIFAPQAEPTTSAPTAKSSPWALDGFAKLVGLKQERTKPSPLASLSPLLLTPSEARRLATLPANPTDLPDTLRSALLTATSPPLNAVFADVPHAGLAQNPFDLRKVVAMDDLARRALTLYLSPGFPRLGVDGKQTVLQVIEPLLRPDQVAELQRFHLPRPVVLDSRGQPTTMSLEVEQWLQTRLELLDFYAPDPRGRLDPRALPGKFVDRLAPRGNVQAWARMSTQDKRKSLRWKDFSKEERFLYLRFHAALVDPKVALHRIENPKATPRGMSAPKTLADKIIWEGPPLGTAEVTTKASYPSMDALFADAAFLIGISPEPIGFHTHHVVEMSTPEDVKRIGPKLTALAALQDLQIFARGVRGGSTVLSHTHLEVFGAWGINEVAESFAAGKIDPDVIGIHKFHCVGIRTEIYGDDRRVGLEIRGVPMGDYPAFGHANVRMNDIIASDRLDRLDPPPWSAWNAGDEGLPDRVYESAKADPKFADVAVGADMELSHLFELGSQKTGKRDAFKFASPLWNFESLPGVTDAERATIGRARDKFVRRTLELSRDLTVAVASERELDTDPIREELTKAVRRFFAETKVDLLIDRHLNEIAYGEVAA